jgi:flagellar biosynthesis GTPase FlhF
MAKARRRSIWDRMTSAWHARDEAAFKAAVRDAEEAEEREDDDDPAHHHVTVNVNHSGSESNTEHEKDTEDSTIKQLADSVKAIDSRLAKVEDSLKHFDASKAEKDAKEEKEAKEDKDKARDEEVEIEQEILSGDARGKSRDEAMRAAFQDTLARAEILAPGIRLPTHDAKADAKATFRSLCALRRRALDVAQATDAGRASVAPLLGARTVDAMSCAEVRAVFVSASEIAKRSNNGVTAGGTFDRSYSSVKIPTPAEINAKNREFWKQRQV